MSRDLALGLLGVLAQREGDVVEQVLRAEQRAVLEQHPEQLADLVELALLDPGDVAAVDDDRAVLRLEQADERLEEDRLAGAGRAEQHGDLTRGQREGDVLPDRLAAEPLGEVLDLDLDTHWCRPSSVWVAGAGGPGAGCQAAAVTVLTGARARSVRAGRPSCLRVGSTGTRLDPVKRLTASNGHSRCAGRGQTGHRSLRRRGQHSCRPGRPGPLPAADRGPGPPGRREGGPPSAGPPSRGGAGTT